MWACVASPVLPRMCASRTCHGVGSPGQQAPISCTNCSPGGACIRSASVATPPAKTRNSDGDKTRSASMRATRRAEAWALLACIKPHGLDQRPYLQLLLGCVSRVGGSLGDIQSACACRPGFSGVWPREGSISILVYIYIHIYIYIYIRIHKGPKYLNVGYSGFPYWESYLWFWVDTSLMVEYLDP